MIRAITLIPGSGECEDLTYNERVSRDRGLHVLLQDRSSDKLPSHRRFLLNAYREIVSRYISFGKIEHPRPLATQLVRFLEDLSRGVDCRVYDFREIGFYVLFHDGDVCYLLASRGDKAWIRFSGAYEELSRRDLPGVTELPVERLISQRELFARGLDDFLALYKIQVPAGGTMDVVLGGGREDLNGVVGVVKPGGTSGDANGYPNVTLESISQKMLFVRIEGASSVRAVSYGSSTGRTSAGSIKKAGKFALTALLALVFVSLGAIWLSDRLSGDGPATIRTQVSSQPGPAATEAVVAVAEETSADSPDQVVTSLLPQPGPEIATTADSRPVLFSVVWDRSYAQPVTSSPSIVGNKVVFGARDGGLYALDKAGGQVLWRYRAADGIGASPGLSNDRVIAADYQGNVFAVGLDDGKQLWKNKLPQKIISSPSVAGGEVLVGCFDGNAYALSVESGRILWKVKTGGRIRGSPAFSDGQFYIPSYDHKIYAVSAGTGTVRWTYQFEGGVSSSPDADGAQVVVGGADGGIYSIDAKTGRLRWKFSTEGAVKSFVRLQDGKVYAGSNDRALYCIDGDSGRMIWKHSTGDVVFSRPALTGGCVIFASYDNNVYCLDAETGEELDRFDCKGPVYSSPAVDGDRVYFGNNNGKFYSLTYRQKGTS